MVTEEIREREYQKNKSRLVWRRLHQLQEHKGAAKQKNLELRNQQGEIVCAIPEILQQMQEHIQNEHYRKPEQPTCLTTPTMIWKETYQQAKEHIHPKIIAKRQQSRLYKYCATDAGTGTAEIMTSQITEVGITQAISPLQNRKSVGEDGITAEVIGQNQLWILPILSVILRNCQITSTFPKQWLRGIMTFAPKGGKRVKQHFATFGLSRSYK